MSNISAVNSNQTYNQDTQSLTGNSDIGKDAFLKILMIQLQNQDPLNPVQDKDFIAQMAQFSSLEQLQELNKQLSTNQELLYSINYSIQEQNENLSNILDDLSNSINKIQDNQNESIDKNVDMINELINLNKAISTYKGE